MAVSGGVCVPARDELASGCLNVGLLSLLEFLPGFMAPVVVSTDRDHPTAGQGPATYRLLLSVSREHFAMFGLL